MAARGRSSTDVDGVRAVSVGGVAVENGVGADAREANNSGCGGRGLGGVDSEWVADGGVSGGERGRSALDDDESTLVVEEGFGGAWVRGSRSSICAAGGSVQDVDGEGGVDGSTRVVHVGGEVSVSSGVSSESPVSRARALGDVEDLSERSREWSYTSSRGGDVVDDELVGLLLCSVATNGHPEDEVEGIGRRNIQDIPCVA